MLLLLSLASIFLCLGARAQSASAGRVSGRVTDARTKLALSGTRVTIVETGQTTFADASGNYAFNNVPSGTQAIEFAYVGYPEVRQTARVDSGATATVDVAFGSEAVQMKKIVIDGSLVGSARAINQQRSASTLTSIVAADEIGRFPDQNAAESLQRLPGVALYRDQGEGRFVDLRGLNYIYTSVTLNGSKVASPEVGNRAIALDIVPADTLASLEVRKVSTPDYDAEGLGGVVNIRTKSPFDVTGLAVQASAQAIYSDLTEQFGSKFDASASNLFANGKAGLLVSATWQQRSFGSQNFEINDGWILRNAPGTTTPFFFLQDLAYRDYEIERTRYGATATLEFRPEAGTRVEFKATYNRFTDAENRHVLFLPFGRGTVTALDANSATVTGMSRPRRDLRNREKDQELFAFSGAVEKKVGPWTLEGQLSTSRGHELKPAEIVTRFRRNQSDTSFRYSFTGTYELALEQLSGPSVTDPANYNTVDRVELAREEGTETDTNFGLNARHDFAGNLRSFVKFGGAYRTKEKESSLDITRFTSPASFTYASLAGAPSDYPYGPRVAQIDPTAMLAQVNGNRAAFTGTALQPDSQLDDWTADETVLAGYAMAGVTFGATTLSGGARVERTKFETSGSEIRGVVITPTTARRNYDNLLPSVVLRHDFNRRLVGRAAISTSLMRPAFGETAIFRSVADTDRVVDSGNPRLSTLEARSLDASLEYYLPSLGVVSAAVFHKKIENFSYAITVPGGDPAFPGYDLITYRNGSDGRVSGLELAWQQQLRMLPAPFDGFGLMANATFADSKATYPTRPGESLPFIGQSNLTGNVALTYEKYGFFGRVALNWRDAHLREDEPFGGNDTEDRWIDDFAQVDISTGYRFARNLEAFVEVLNVTNEPFRVFMQGEGYSPRFVQFEEYGWTANFGLRWKL